MATFVDTNVLISLLNPDEAFHEWAQNAMKKARDNGAIIACDIVYAELSVNLADEAETDETIARMAIVRLPFSNAVLYRAGQAYKEHRRRGGSRNNVLSDFLIGAQAEVEGAPLLTNNERDYRSYFDRIRCIAPEKKTADSKADTGSA